MSKALVNNIYILVFYFSSIVFITTSCKAKPKHSESILNKLEYRNEIFFEIKYSSYLIKKKNTSEYILNADEYNILQKNKVDSIEIKNKKSSKKTYKNYIYFTNVSDTVLHNIKFSFSYIYYHIHCIEEGWEEEKGVFSDSVVSNQSSTNKLVVENNNNFYDGIQTYAIKKLKPNETICVLYEKQFLFRGAKLKEPCDFYKGIYSIDEAQIEFTYKGYIKKEITQNISDFSDINYYSAFE
jgi:hypothetical protein